MAQEIYIAPRRSKEKFLKIYGGDRVYDLTSKGSEPWVKFSPFYPVGDIPVPHWPGMTASSVEGIWQGLKRFEFENEVDISRFSNISMRNLKRTSKAKGKYGILRGEVLGHQQGIEKDVLLDYYAARTKIYLPAYHWVLDHKLSREICLLKEATKNSPIVLLDYETNFNVKDLSRPLSHCSLVRHYLLSSWPDDKSK